MRKLVFLALTCGAVLLGLNPALGQEAKVYRLGVIGLTSETLAMVRAVTVPELEKLGFAEGRNLIIEMRSGRPDELPVVAQDLVSRKPDAILAIGTPPIVAAKEATQTVPIVMYGTMPIELGYAEKLSRPGANVTGIVILSDELDGERLELLLEAAPSARRIAALIPPARSLQQRAVNDASLREMSRRAATAGIELLPVEATDDYGGAFLSMRIGRSDGIVIATYPQFRADIGRLAQFAKEARLSTVCPWREMAEQGCLLSYGPNLTVLYRRAAEYVARLFKGAAPSDLPIEQPTHLELVVNLKTAKVLGIEVPPSFLARADEVIE
jgi:putative ABC transport system substrate-binding protein